MALSGYPTPRGRIYGACACGASELMPLVPTGWGTDRRSGSYFMTKKPASASSAITTITAAIRVLRCDSNALRTRPRLRVDAGGPLADVAAFEFFQVMQRDTGALGDAG